GLFLFQPDAEKREGPGAPRSPPLIPECAGAAFEQGGMPCVRQVRPQKDLEPRSGMERECRGPETLCKRKKTLDTDANSGCGSRQRLHCRRHMRATPARPGSSRNAVAGSGTSLGGGAARSCSAL